MWLLLTDEAIQVAVLTTCIWELITIHIDISHTFCINQSIKQQLLHVNIDSDIIYTWFHLVTTRRAEYLNNLISHVVVWVLP